MFDWIPNQATSKMKHFSTISVNLENFRFWDQISPKKYERQRFLKNKH